MPRLPRIDIPETFYHVYTRGNNKAPIFIDDIDRQAFIRFLLRTQQLYSFKLCAYCLMGNHYHLQIKTEDYPLAKIMHSINNLYAGFFNHRHGQVGHLFQNRYCSIPIWDSAYLIRLNRYIHLNPHVAGLVDRPEAYKWSSYKGYIEAQARETFISYDPILSLFGTADLIQQQSYRRYVEEHMGKVPEFSDDVLVKTRSFSTAGHSTAGRSKSASTLALLDRPHF
jgi:putative transposase